MRRIRLYSDQPMSANMTITLSGPPAHHLLRVLRRRVGDSVVLFNGNGEEHQGDITALEGRDACCIDLTETTRPETESPLQITLLQAVGRGDRMDWALQKSVELGVQAIQPLLTERTEVRLSGPRAEKRQAHWQQVVISACEQSGRVRIPVVRPVAGLAELTIDNSLGVHLDPEAEQALDELPITIDSPISLAIGPEGGFSEKETVILRSLGFTSARLGPRILRTETAGPAALAILQSRFGDC